jgi:parallel beta-helix repeat protein
MRKIMVYLMVVVLVGMVFAAVPTSVSAEYVGDITIMADGSVAPADAPVTVNGMIYTLTDDVAGTIRIEKHGATLCGGGNSVVGDGGGAGVLAIGMMGVTIKNLVVTNFYHGIVLVDSSACTVKENDAYGCVDAGIYLTGSNANTVKDNKAHDNVWEGIWLENSHYNCIKDNEAWNCNEGGILLWPNCDYNTIKDNYLHACGQGNSGAGILVISDSDNNVVKNNDMSDGNTLGMALNDGSDYNLITENTAENNLLGGIYVYFGAYNTVSRNVIRKNLASGHDGVRVYVSISTTIQYNEISDVYRGLLVLWNPAGTSNLFTENTIKNCYKGMQLSFNSYTNEIHHNNFLHNKIQVQDHGIGNMFDDGSEGNFWSDYNGKDADKDGIGDTPYLIDGAAGSLDNCPLMKPWSW